MKGIVIRLIFVVLIFIIKCWEKKKEREKKKEKECKSFYKIINLLN